MLSTIDHIILDEEAALLKQSPRGSFNDKNNMTMMCNGGGGSLRHLDPAGGGD